ncbi:MAG: ATP-dependent endonuclease [Pirellulaceae bacterium]
MSRVLHSYDAGIPPLAELEEKGRLIFLPLGGGGVAAWADRLAPLGLREFHLLDREVPPETDVRRRIVQRVNQRDGCRAFLTRKRSIENYLHPHALLRAGGQVVDFGDFDPVPDLVAKASFQQEQPAIPWETLSRRAHKRLINRVKRWLNTKVVEQMTFELLAERDPNGEVVSWLKTIAGLAGQAE